jgi:hypothetical protein
LTWITEPSSAAIGAIASLAEADRVIASEATNAAPISTIRLMQESSPSLDCDVQHKFQVVDFVPRQAPADCRFVPT